MPAVPRDVAGWPRALLGLALAVVASSVLGMHQLSVDHILAAAEPRHHQTTGASTSALAGAPADTVSSVPMTGREPTHPCSGCDDHDALAATCLLALTLLVMWRLRPPVSRRLPRTSAGWRPVPTTVPLGRRRTALTLTELSLRRT